MKAGRASKARRATETARAVESPAPYIARYALPAAIAAMTFLVFSPALENDFVNWDDEKNFLNNPHYRGLGWQQIAWMFSTFYMGHYQPLSWLTLGLDYVLWGMNPWGYHLTSMLFHALNSALFFSLAARLLASGSKAEDAWDNPRVVAAAAVAALFFAVHPLRVESVVWITERRDVVSGFFLLATVLLYLRAARAEEGRLRWRYLGASLVVYALSLLSKAAGITLPVVLLVLDVYPLRRLGWGAGWLGRSARGVWLEKAPFFLLAGIFAVVALVAQSREALMSLEEHGPGARLAQALFGVVFYPWKTLFPLGLSPLYQLRLGLSFSSLPFLVSGLLAVAVTLGLYLCRRRWPAGFAAWLAYLVLVAPVLGVAQSGPQLVADRYSYLSCLSFALLLGAGVGSFWESELRGACLWVAAGVLLAAGAMTRSYISVWRDSERLWRHAVSVDPHSDLAHNNLGTTLLDKGKLDEAIAEFRKAAAMNPRYLSAHYNLGLALTKTGDLDGAIQSYRRALEIKPESPEVMNNLGIALATKGDIAGAMEQFQRALEFEGSRSESHFNMGTVFALQGRYEEALRQFDEALKLRPDFARAHHRKGTLLALRGESERALWHIRKAVDLEPGSTEARLDLANALAGQGRLQEAIHELEDFLRRQPDSAPGYNGLGRLFAAKGELDRAIALFREALRLDPNFHPARESLTMALQEKAERDRGARPVEAGGAR